MSQLTVIASGQTLVVDAVTHPAAVGATLYSDAALSTPVTLPDTIRADTTYYLSPGTNVLRVTVDTKAGDSIYDEVRTIRDPDHAVIHPLPSAAQTAARVSDHILTSPNATAYRLIVDNAGVVTTEAV